MGGTGDEDVRRALVTLAEAREATYFDESVDAQARDGYYADLERDLRPEELFRALSGLVTRTHHAQPTYKPSVHLYPAVDLQPNGQLRSIYTGDDFAPEDFIVDDAQIEQRRVEAVQARMTTGTTRAARQAVEAEIEAELPFNCEHVVPQSWFAKREPMRGDLHHLFSCEKRCNSFRGNTPFFDFADFRDVVRERCGKTGASGFEPHHGKGPAARATFYFLVRYPGEINRIQELDDSRVELLLAWHETFEVSEYERHRNMLIHANQGNRNPFVDEPALAVQVALALGLG